MQINDIFNEQLVARKSNKADGMKKAGVIALGLILGLIVIGIPSLAALQLPLLVGVVVLIVFVMRRFNVEYEYVFTNGELDIDRIVNKSSRKRVFSIHVTNIEVMVAASNKEYAREVETFTKSFDFSSGVIKENTFIAICDANNVRTRFTFEPNEKMFDAIRSYIPRKIKK